MRKLNRKYIKLYSLTRSLIKSRNLSKYSRNSLNNLGKSLDVFAMNYAQTMMLLMN